MTNYLKKLEKLQIILHLNLIEPDLDLHKTELQFDDGTYINHFWTSMGRFEREKKHSTEQKDRNIISMITLIKRIRKEYNEQIIEEKLEYMQNMILDNPTISFFYTDEKFPDGTYINVFWRPIIYSLKETDERYIRHQQRIEALKQVSENKTILKLDQMILILKKNPSWGINELKQACLSNGANIYNSYYYIKEVLRDEIAEAIKENRELSAIDKVISKKIEIIEELLVKNKYHVIDSEMDELYQGFYSGKNDYKKMYYKIVQRAKRLAHKKELLEEELYFLQSLANFENMIIDYKAMKKKRKK